MKFLKLCLVAMMVVGIKPGSCATVPAHDPCQAPDDVAGVVTSLPNVAAVLKANGTLRVLAVGSATMFGPDATLAPGTITSQALGIRPSSTALPDKALSPDGTEQAFPWQMARSLQTTIPGLKVEVVLRGGRGLTAAEMLEVIRKELKAGSFQLVLWQTGTVEAVRNAPPGGFAEILANGAEEIEQAGANLVLIDPQYSRFLQTNSNLDPYMQALQQTASMPGVELFHRFDLMRSWAADGQIDLERTQRADRRQTVETLHSCLGVYLARMVVAGARS